MATNTNNTNGGRIVSPPARAKRERWEEELMTRRVSQRTDNGATSIVDIVKNGFKSDDVKFLGESLDKLAALLYNEDLVVVKKRQLAFYQVGGHAKVVDIMNKHVECESIQRGGVVVLTNATHNHSELQVAVAMVDGIQAIISAMKKYPSEQVINRVGLKTLCNLTCTGIADHHAELLVTELDAVPLIISHMNSFSGHASIMQCACTLLYNLSAYPQLIDPIRDSKAITALAAALDNHKDEKGVYYWACQALMRLSPQ